MEQGTGIDNRSAVRSVRSCRHRADGKQMPTGHPHLIGSIPSSLLGNNKGTPQGVPLLFGAGYGNRTRLHGLGSRCITDIRTLHSGGIIAEANGKSKPFLSEVWKRHRRFAKNYAKRLLVLAFHYRSSKNMPRSGHSGTPDRGLAPQRSAMTINSVSSKDPAVSAAPYTAPPKSSISLILCRCSTNADCDHMGVSSQIHYSSHFRFHVLLVISTSMGKISSLPASISMISTSLDRGLKPP